MAMARWDPFRDMVPLQDAVNRLVAETLVRPTELLGSAASTAMDVYTEGDTYVIEVAIPGLNPEAIDVSVLGNQVTISGEYPKVAEGRRYFFRERQGGRFERTVTLPTEVDADKAEAHFEHGVLKLVVPKAESAKPRRIALTAGS